MHSVDCRLVIITEIIAPYRIPVFNALASSSGINLHVIFLAETDPTQRQWKVYADEIRFSYEVLPNWRRRFERLHVLLNVGIFSSLRRCAPDLIICGGYNYPAVWQSLLWAKAHRVPVVLWCESTLNDQRNKRKVFEIAKRIFFQACAGFLVPGTASREYVSSFGIGPTEIITAPNAVDISFFTQRADDALRERSRFLHELNLPAHYFLYVGRLVEQKGIFHLLEAYEKMTSQIRGQVGLVFVGDGPDRSRLLQRAAAIAPGRVCWAGFVHREQLPAYYALSDALVLPTLSDPWGLVVNEAMAAGAPVIVTDVAGCTVDLVTHMWNGYVIEAGHLDELSSALESLAGSSRLRSTMGARSRERILKFSPQRCAEGFAMAAGLWK